MPGFYEIRWLSTGRTEGFAGSRGNYYEFSESDRLDLHSKPGWCHHCGKVTHVENLSTVDELDRKIRDLNDSSSDLHRMVRHSTLDELLGTGRDFLSERVAEVQRRRRWREERKSPPKCIHCGTTEIVELPLGMPVLAPHGEGQLQIDCVGMCSTNFNQWFFTPEGDRIPRDTRPTSWHHPELDKPKHKKRFHKWLRSLLKGGDSATS